MTERFPIHIVAETSDICNYEAERKRLNFEVSQGHRILLLGRRNTGKTSLLQSVVIPEFKKKNPNGFVISVDLMSVTNLESIQMRLESGFTQGLRKSFPVRSKLLAVVDLIKGLRPSLNVDPITGQLDVSLSFAKETTPKRLEQMFSQISALHPTHPILLIFDEFQDVHFVPEAEALLRHHLQFLQKDLPVIITGSKNHLLQKMFAAGKAPFANWGLPLELPRIAAEDYLPYMMKRFKPQKITVSLEMVQFMLDALQGIPEAVNIICTMIMDHLLPNGGEISQKIFYDAIDTAIERFASIYRNLLQRVSPLEIQLMSALAHHGPIAQPRGKSFLRLIDSSPAGVSAALKRLEDDGFIYKIIDGYVVSDPLMAEFLKRRH